MKHNIVLSLILYVIIFYTAGCDSGEKKTVLPIGGGGGNVTCAAGDSQRYFLTGNINFRMFYVPAKIFYTGTADSTQSVVNNDFWIGESEITEILWSNVHQFATCDSGGGTRCDDGGPLYHFQNTGSAAGDQYPIANVSWDDCMVWCNALTEWCNLYMATSLTCVYKSGGTPIRDSRSSNYATCHAVVPAAGATGFRLPTGDEWELAARYKIDVNKDGDIIDINEYIRGNNLSGADFDYSNSSVDQQYAWYADNSGGAAHPVKQLLPNTLGLYDMSGNVIEWCEDHFHDEPSRLIRGGCYNDPPQFLQVGYRNSLIDFALENAAYSILGFRVAKNK